VNRAVDGDIVIVEVLSGKELKLAKGVEDESKEEEEIEAEIADEELETPLDPVLGGETLDIELAIKEKKPDRFGKYFEFSSPECS